MKKTPDEIKRWAKDHRPGEKLEIEQRETGSRSVNCIKKEITKL